MPRSDQSSRSTSSYPDKFPLSCQSDSKQRTTYEPRYTSSSSGSSSGRSSNSGRTPLTPLSISRGSHSAESGRSKSDDRRYYESSFLDSSKPDKKPLSCQTKDRDPRYYQNSSYYR